MDLHGKVRKKAEAHSTRCIKKLIIRAVFEISAKSFKDAGVSGKRPT